MERLFWNNNGGAYCILEGNIGEPALLADMNNKSKFIVASRLNATDWNSGMYHCSLGEAYKQFRSLYKKRL